MPMTDHSPGPAPAPAAFTDVLTVAYAAAGSPATPHELEGACARCGIETDQLTRATGRRVVSEQFTAYDGWRSPSNVRGLCPPCTWALTAPALRQHPHQITRTPQADPIHNTDLSSAGFRQLTRSDLAGLLESPLAGDVAVIVPLRPGRKYLLPEAQWGTIATDATRLPWVAADADRLAALQRLRGAGFGSRLLAAPAPPWPVFSRLSPSAWPQVLADWEHLKPWRERTPWLDLAIYATTPDPDHTRSAA